MRILGWKKVPLGHKPRFHIQKREMCNKQDTHRIYRGRGRVCVCLSVEVGGLHTLYYTHCVYTVGDVTPTHSMCV